MNFSELKNLKESISDNLKKIRTQKRLSMSKVSLNTGISERTLYKIEDKEDYTQHSIFNIYKITQFYGISMDELF